MKKVVLFILTATAVLVSCKNEPKEPEVLENVKDLALSETINEEAQSEYLYVTAFSGLTLREFDNLNSEKLAKMPYGTKVRIITPEKKATMNIGGIKGGMNEVEYNHKKGFAFNGYLSKFFPPEPESKAKIYAEELQEFFPRVSYSESVGGTASKPINTESIMLPTDQWHEAFFVAQRLFDFPKEFNFPNPKGKNIEVKKDKMPLKNVWTSELHIARKENTLEKIEYLYKAKKYGYTVTISQVDNSMKITKTEVVE